MKLRKKLVIKILEKLILINNENYLLFRNKFS